MTSLSEHLAEFVISLRPGDIPAIIARQGERAFVNWLGCAFGGCDDPAVRLALDALLPFSGKRTACIVGTAERADLLLATLLNATAVSAHAFDDTHFTSVAHPTAPVAAALLALAQHRPVSGAEFLHALVLGVETQCRVALLLCTPPASCAIGLSMAGLVGGIGAAAASGRCLGLEPAQLACAIGLAANEAAGLRENHATLASAATPGHAARSGLQAALLARAGYSCSPTVLEGSKGFGASFSAGSQPGAVLADLGARWEIETLAFKPYPTGFVVHPVIDACLEVARNNRIDPAAVDAVELAVNPLVVALTDRPSPANRLDAIVSTQHWAAIALIRRDAGLREGADDAVRSKDVAELRHLVRLLPSEQLGREQARVTVRMQDGCVYTAEVSACRGSAGRPLTDAELDEKFLAQTTLHLPEAEAADRLHQAWRVRELAEVGPAVEALLGPAAPG